jgi:sugar/nucleoside kinase (ribokinase family)
MSNTRFDVLGLGNAIVDVFAHAEDDFLVAQNLRKGAMLLVDEPEAERLYAAMGAATVMSGGAVANSIVGVASLGGRGAYVGKVKQDAVGAQFTHDIRAMGVHFETAPAVEGPATARSMILVTPDGERTMNTFLGACQELGPADVDEALVRASATVYLEGYLWDRPQAKEAFRRAGAIAHAAGRQVALTLSDSFCVDRFRDEFLELIRSGMLDIVFANESELKSLYQTADFDTAVAAFRAENAGDRRVLGVITRSAQGCLVVARDESHAVPAHPIERLVDTTGAGDLFAAGFLFGLARDLGAVKAARVGAMAAAEVIQHVGARPATSLKALAEENGLL